MPPLAVPAFGLLAALSAANMLPANGQQLPAQTTISPPVAGRVSGTVAEAATGQPVAYASVAALASTGAVVEGTVGGSDGQFVLSGLPAGTYTLRVSAVGYLPFARAGVVVPVGGTVALGTLSLTAAAQQLGEVVVAAHRPLVEEKADRTVYHAEYDQTARGGDATDVLRRVPLLSVDLDGNVSVRGNSSIRVLINNKPSTITAASVADGLRQIPADQIKTVEVITSPSAKYDAEGSGGVINIITKTSDLRGGQLSLDGTSGIRSATLNLNGGYRTGRMGFALGGFGRAGYNTPGSFGNEQLAADPASGTPTRTAQVADTRQHQLFGRYTLGWDYDLSQHDALAASLTYGTRNATTYQDALLTQATTPTTGAASRTTRDTHTTDNSGTVDGSLTYTHLYDAAQRELSALALLSYTARTYAFGSNTYQATDAASLGPAGNDNPNTNQELTTQLDYQTPTGRDQLLEMGVKGISRLVTSDYTYSGQLARTQAGNSFTYRQQIAAGYVAYSIGLPQGFTLKPGVRYEYTALGADVSGGQLGGLPGYGALVPGISILRRLANGNALKLAYNRRLQRPSLQFLNPNLQAANPFAQLQGNPLLGPEFTNNYELGYSTLLGPANLSFSAFARTTSGSIQSVRTPLARAEYPGAVLVTYQNIGQESAYGGSAFASLNVGSKLSLNGGVDAYYLVLRNNVADPSYAARNAGLVVGGRLYGSYALPKGWGVQVFGFYRGQQVQLQGSQSNFALYSMSLKHDIAQKKGSLGLGAENFFSPRNMVSTEISTPLLRQSSTTVQHLTSFKVYFSYRIGQLSAESRARKRVRNDDLKVDENGGGSQSSSTTPDATRAVPAAPATPAPATPPGTSSPAAPQAPAPVRTSSPSITPPGGTAPAGGPGGRP